METALIVLHVIICILLVVVVILQKGKGAEMGAAFGVGSSSAVFGPKGPTPFLAKVTVGLATLFFINSLVLAIVVGKPKYAKAIKAVPVVETQKKQQSVKPAPLPKAQEPVKESNSVNAATNATK